MNACLKGHNKRKRGRGWPILKIIIAQSEYIIMTFYLTLVKYNKEETSTEISRPRWPDRNDETGSPKPDRKCRRHHRHRERLHQSGHFRIAKNKQKI